MYSWCEQKVGNGSIEVIPKEEGELDQYQRLNARSWWGSVEKMDIFSGVWGKDAYLCHEHSVEFKVCQVKRWLGGLCEIDKTLPK